MKMVSQQMIDHVAQPAFRLATCWRIERADAVVSGFTDSNDPIDYDGVTYSPAASFARTAITARAGTANDNLDVEGILSADAILESDLLFGVYDYAKVRVFAVNPDDLSMGDIPMIAGSLGPVSTTADGFRAQLLGLAWRLNSRMGEVTTPNCRAIFGSARCGVNKQAYTSSHSVSAVVSRRAFVVSTLTGAPTDAYTTGELTFTSGANAGSSHEVKSVLSGTVTLYLPTSYPIEVGATFTITEGCDKRFKTCRDRFHNEPNFQGEPDIPGADTFFQHAGRTVE